MSIPTRPTYAGRRWLLLLSLLLGLAAHAVPERYSYDPGRSEIMRLVAAEAMAEGLAPDLALAVARVESDFVASAVSPAGAVGVMQIMPATAWGEFLVPREDLFNAEVNVNLGVRFLKQLIDRYGDVEIACPTTTVAPPFADRPGRCA
jgi:soluble lytic murein transglycosylase-like protein